MSAIKEVNDIPPHERYRGKGKPRLSSVSRALLLVFWRTSAQGRRVSPNDLPIIEVLTRKTSGC
jgi:hypothetical protein